VSHIFLAEDVELLGGQHLDSGEAITVHLLELHDVFDLLKQDAFLQSLMAAPLWKFFYERDIR